MSALAEAAQRRARMPQRQTLVDPLSEKWEAVMEAVHLVVADTELADRVLVAIANVMPPSVAVEGTP